MKQVLIVCGVVVATVAVAATSAFAYYTYRGKKSTKYIHVESEWQDTSETETSYESSSEEPINVSATITADSLTFTVDDSMFETYEVFASNDYLQNKIISFLDNVEPSYIADTYEFDGKVMRVMIQAEPENVELVIDKSLGGIYLE